MIKPTARQIEIIDFISIFMEANNQAPTYAQIALHLGIKARVSIHHHIKRMAKKGLLDRPYYSKKKMTVLFNG